MEFSMIFEAQIAGPTPESERQLMHDCVEQAVLAEEMGFDRVWAVEHHTLHQYAHMSAPEIFLTYVAAKTSRIRIAHGVICLPFKYNHPIRVAERTAMLDILSNGRLDVGFGKGSTDQELDAFGVDKDRAYDEVLTSLSIIPKMWQEETFELESELLTIPSRRILPKPVQDPHPPMFLACTRSEMFEYAGAHGLGALALGFAGPDDVATKNKLYRNAIASRNEDDVVGAFANDKLVALCPAIVLEDRDEAQHIGFRGQRFFVEAIAQWKGGPPPNPDTYDVDNEAALLAMQEATLKAKFGSEDIKSISIDEIRTSGLQRYNINQAYGNPDDAIAYIERLIEAGADEIMFIMQMGTVPQGAILESIRQIGQHVIPHFAGKHAAVA
ncbi:MAG TPA: LLM class flavin-dependent oxidoreductase [Candidatus Limnocylindrales bacterium]|jgi:alkanesulfonate monooxygenase SsuD/methylene tetrahydromethanopterin reductase-like flavin-dependent oxidoreductase (luciferase family)|nr:LLM class flavin-dependent oxidoreductase [Candidatus Limnocylindrales bacterium]